MGGAVRNLNFTAISLLACSLVGLSATARGPLTFEERLEAQEAIERVYHRHRNWPSQNAAPAPAFESAVSKDLIARKVKTYLRESQALDVFWAKPISSDQLQAEVDRLCRNTKSPSLLRELFAALKRDPLLVAECLARPSLADRLCRNWYAYDSRFHSRTQILATVATRELAQNGMKDCSTGSYSHTICQVGRQEEEMFPGLPRPTNGITNLSRENFDNLARRLPPEGETSAAEETADTFVIRHVFCKNKDRLELEQRVFEKRPFSDWWASVELNLPLTLREPVARYQFGPLSAVERKDAEDCQDTWKSMAQDLGRWNFCSVWSGSEMLVWGGATWAGLSRGGVRYNPATDTWSEMSIGPGCPKGRYFPSAVWSGSEMIVWGGCERTDYVSFPDYDVNTGGRYDPVADTWIPTPTDAGCPSPRARNSGVWTGAEMIIWGGYGTDTYSCRDGARFSPATGTWTTLPAGPPELLGREDHSAIWTGTEMIVWGGQGWNPETGYGFVWLNSGACYNPRTDTWRVTSIGTGCPSPRSRHASVWTGQVMLVWGGDDFNTTEKGAIYDPITDDWKPMSCGPGCPDLHFDPSVVWTGHEMIVWGGADGPTTGNYSGRYDPELDAWQPVATGPNCPEPRARAAAVWTGSEMIVWGGGNVLNSGGRYNPLTDSWLPTARDEGYVSARYSHAAVWTGSEMLVWGGNDGDSAGQYYNPRGTRYSPVLDSWSPMSTGQGCPIGRANVPAIWTGKEMVVWGGYNIATSQLDQNTGGRFDPVSDTWRATSTGTGCPSARSLHTMVWTGSEIIVWGGQHSYGGALATDSARYDPLTDTWRAVTSNGSPVPRAWHTAVWTGREMIVWGGWGDNGSGSSQFLNSGGRYAPTSDTWVSTSQGPGCPVPRSAPSSAWINGEMFIWGGGFNDGTQVTYYRSGGLYSPETDSWSETSTGPGCPDGRYGNTCVAAGSKAILWGGVAFPSLNTGGVYDAATDSWMPTSDRTLSNFGLAWHSAVWADDSMIVWGGLTAPGFPVASGAIYQLDAGPSTIPSCDAHDVAPCTVGVLVSWPQDPGNWRDSGMEAARSYRVYRDGVPLSSGGCSGLRTYGDTACTDDSADWDGTHSFQIAYVNGCGTSSAGNPVMVWDHAVPRPANYPVPADGLTRVMLTGSLSWKPSSGAESYDIFFGTTSTPPFVANVRLPSFSLSSLQEQTRYYWRVIPHNSCGQPPVCPTWSFTSILLPHTIKISWVRPIFDLKVNGSGFQSGIRCFVNGREWTNVLWKSQSKIVLRGGGYLKPLIPKGAPAALRFLNPDGGEANVTWQW